MSPLRLGFAPNNSVLPSNTCSTPFSAMNNTSSTIELDYNLRVLRRSIPFISRRVSTSGAWSTFGICKLSILTPSSINYYFNSYISSSRSDLIHWTANGLFWKCRADTSEGMRGSMLFTATLWLYTNPRLGSVCLLARDLREPRDDLVCRELPDCLLARDDVLLLLDWND